VTDLFIEGGRALVENEIAKTPLKIAGYDIAAVGAGHRRGSLGIDAEGLLVLPGIVDLHGDAFERQMMPRPGVDFPIDVALVDSDRQAISNGITTVFHATTWSWEPGLRCGNNARKLLEAIESMRPQLAADTVSICATRPTISTPKLTSPIGCRKAVSTCSPSTITWIRRLPTLPNRRSAAA
jgi:alpha-D-ribose 1-methylphosphonate 5-triphosphate diphosphatase